MLVARATGWSIVPLYVASTCAYYLLIYTPGLWNEDAVVENVQGVMLNVGFGAFAVVGALLVIRRPTNTIGFTTTQTLFRTLMGQQQQPPQLVVVVSTLAIAALFIHFIGASRRSSTGAFSGASTTPGRHWKRSPPCCATRRTWTCSTPNWWGWSGDDAAGVRLALAAPRISFEGSAGRLSGSPAEDRGVLHSLATLRYL